MKMIDVVSNISGYFDEDFENIIYKDLRTNGFSDEEVEKLLSDKYRDLPMMEENIFKLNNYKLGSIGFTSRELENLKIDFCEEKLLSNDYNALTALGKDKEISADVEAKDIETLSKNKEFLLDVREEYEYEEGHVKGAVNLPLREILSQKDSLPKDRDIYVYCRTAHRSADAVNFLKSLGFDKVHNVEGGFIDISFYEYHKDKGNLENSIVTNYNFD